MACAKQQAAYGAAVIAAAAACGTSPTGVGLIACGLTLYTVADTLDSLQTCKEEEEAKASEAAAVRLMIEQINRERARLEEMARQTHKVR
jgi:hypothetical protein